MVDEQQPLDPFSQGRESIPADVFSDGCPRLGRIHHAWDEAARGARICDGHR